MSSDRAFTRSVSHWAAVLSLWIGLILAVVEAIIGARFVLKLAGAAEGNGFVDFIYDLSGPLVQPFQGIFDRETVGDDGIFEPESLIALIVYPLAALLLIAIVRTLVASAPLPSVDAWDRTARDVYVRLSRLHDALAARAAPGALSAADLHAAEAQIDEASADLHTLELDPPHERAALAVRDVIVTLSDVRGALPLGQVEPAPVEGGAPRADLATELAAPLRDRLADLDGALQRFRELI